MAESQEKSIYEFESLIAELQETVKRMEGDELPLAEAIDAYERAVAIAARCSTMLEEAELRITRIDAASHGLREEASIYQAGRLDAARLLLGDDEEELFDLLDDE